MTTNFNGARQISSYGLDKALDAIGDGPKRKLVYHLDVDYGISLEKPVIHCADLERALYNLVGSGADIIMQMIQSSQLRFELK